MSRDLDSAQAIRTLWERTGDQAPAYPRLENDLAVDVVIIGGGFTGLSTALHLSRSGHSCAVLESESVGYGASGRNGGFVSGKFRVSFPAMARVHGRDVALRMYQLGSEAIDCVEETVATLSIDGAAFSRAGHVVGASSEAQLDKLRASVDWLRTEARDAATKMLSGSELRDETGSTAFIGGTLNTAGGGIQPLNFVRGLARGAERAGARIFENSTVARVREEGNAVTVEAGGGRIRAGQAVIATNAYTDTTTAAGSLYKRVIPFRSDVISTVPLSSSVLGNVMPARRLYSDSKRLLRWFRIFGDRVVVGGRAALADDRSEASFKGLAGNMVELFPVLRGVPLEYKWSGLVAMTTDFLPHVGHLRKRVLYALGYNGTGVAMATLMGKYLSRMIRGEPCDVALLTADRFLPVPFYALRAPAIRAVAGWYRLLDGMGR